MVKQNKNEEKRVKVQKKVCKCDNYKVVADYRNEARDPRGKVIQCQDCGRIFDK